MNKTRKILLSIITIIVGWLLGGLAYSTPIGGHPVNTICLLVGVGMLFSGIIWLIIILINI